GTLLVVCCSFTICNRADWHGAACISRYRHHPGWSASSPVHAWAREKCELGYYHGSCVVNGRVLCAGFPQRILWCPVFWSDKVGNVRRFARSGGRDFFWTSWIVCRAGYRSGRRGVRRRQTDGRRRPSWLGKFAG